MFADLEIVSNRIDKLKTNSRSRAPPRRKRRRLEPELAVAAHRRRLRGEPVAGDARPEGGRGEGDPQLPAADAEAGTRAAQHRRRPIGQPLPPICWHLAPDALQAPAKLEMELHDLGGGRPPDVHARPGLKGLCATTCCGRSSRRWARSSSSRSARTNAGRGRCRRRRRGEGAGQIHTDLARGFVRARWSATTISSASAP